MTIKEAARFLRVAPITLYRKVRRGEVPASKLGRSWRFHREQLEEWIKKPPPVHRLPPVSSPLFRHLSGREAESTLKFIEEIRKENGVEKVILYGSKARGDFRENSDIDLLLVLHSRPPFLKKAILEKARQISLEEEVLLQILILSKQEWEEPSFKTFLLVEKIKREGIPLYG